MQNVTYGQSDCDSDSSKDSDGDENCDCREKCDSDTFRDNCSSGESSCEALSDADAEANGEEARKFELAKSLQNRLSAFYKLRNPVKLPLVETFVSRCYESKRGLGTVDDGMREEASLLRQLRQKYAVRIGGRDDLLLRRNSTDVATKVVGSCEETKYGHGAGSNTNVSDLNANEHSERIDQASCGEGGDSDHGEEGGDEALDDGWADLAQASRRVRTLSEASDPTAPPSDVAAERRAAIRIAKSVHRAARTNDSQESSDYEQQQKRSDIVIGASGVLQRVLRGTGPWTAVEDQRLRSLVRAYRLQTKATAVATRSAMGTEREISRAAKGLRPLSVPILRRRKHEERGGQWGWISRRMGSTLYAPYALGCSKRSAIQCMHRWQNVLVPGLIRGKWTPKEDEILWGVVADHADLGALGAPGPSSKHPHRRRRKNESILFGDLTTRDATVAHSLHGRRIDVSGVPWAEAAAVLGRPAKRCRERFINHLDPSIRKDPWTFREDTTLFQMQRRIGNRWTQIALALPGRTQNQIKNRFHSSAKKKFEEAESKSNSAKKQENLEPKDEVVRKRKCNQWRDDDEPCGWNEREKLKKKKTCKTTKLTSSTSPPVLLTMDGSVTTKIKKAKNDKKKKKKKKKKEEEEKKKEKDKKQQTKPFCAEYDLGNEFGRNSVSDATRPSCKSTTPRGGNGFLMKEEEWSSIFR
jgi:hypothetical protein